MKRLWWVAVLLSGCATTSRPAAPAIDACNLTDETACVAYGAAAAPSVSTPSGQLVVGLADRAASLPPEEAVDYWRRIVDVVAASDQSDSTVNRRASASYAALAAFAVDDVGADGEVMEEALAESHEAVERVRDLAEFAVKWGSPETQARGARAIADAYARQADALAGFELPSELTQDGRQVLAGKRDDLVRELRAEVELLRAGLREHCQAHKLKLAECELSEMAEQRISKKPRPRVVLDSGIEGAEALTVEEGHAAIVSAAIDRLEVEGSSPRIFFYAFDGDFLEFVEATLIEQPQTDPPRKQHARWKATARVKVRRSEEAIELLQVRDVISMHEDGVCGVRIGMPKAAVVNLLGEPDEILHVASAGCAIHEYGDLAVTMCFDAVRDVRRSGEAYEMNLCP